MDLPSLVQRAEIGGERERIRERELVGVESGGLEPFEEAKGFPRATVEGEAVDDGAEAVGIAVGGVGDLACFGKLSCSAKGSDGNSCGR